MSEEIEKEIREKILPESIDLSKMDIWSFDWLDSGIEDFTEAAIQKRCRVRLVSEDYRMEVLINLNPKK